MKKQTLSVEKDDQVEWINLDGFSIAYFNPKTRALHISEAWAKVAKVKSITISYGTDTLYRNVKVQNPSKGHVKKQSESGDRRSA